MRSMEFHDKYLIPVSPHLSPLLINFATEDDPKNVLLVAVPGSSPPIWESQTAILCGENGLGEYRVRGRTNPDGESTDYPFPSIIEVVYSPEVLSENDSEDVIHAGR